MIGVGIYFLTIIWFITLMLCWVSIRTGHNIGKIAIIIALAISLVLALLRSKEEYSSANFYDKLFVIRYSVLSLLVLSVIVGLGYSFVYVCLEPCETVKIHRLGATY